MVHVWMDFQTFAKGLCAVEGGLYLKGIVKIEASVTDRINSYAETFVLYFNTQILFWNRIPYFKQWRIYCVFYHQLPQNKIPVQGGQNS